MPPIRRKKNLLDNKTENEMPMKMNAIQKKTSNLLLLPNEVVRQIVFFIPKIRVHDHKSVSPAFDKYIEERTKLEVTAELTFRMKGKQGKKQLDQIKYNLLRICARIGSVWKVRYLLKQADGVILGWLQRNKYQLLHRVLCGPNKAPTEIVQLLLEHGVPAEAKCPPYRRDTKISEKTAFEQAGMDIYKKLIEFGRGMPLHIAARKGYLDICKLLVKHGADPNSIEEYFFGDGPLFDSARYALVGVVNFLLQNGANVCAADFLGRTALHAAMFKPHLNIARMLLEEAERKGGIEAKRALIEARDKFGRRAIHEAYNQSKIDMREFLEEQLPAKP